MAAAAAPGLEARVTILDPVHCPRYAARLMTGLTVAPSPFWMRRRLQMAGLRAINNLVDVTNYVLLEFGQPLHAFDFERLRNGEIVVRLPKSGERRFTTLDGVERELDPETLLICDAEAARGPGRDHGGARFRGHRVHHPGVAGERLFQSPHHPPDRQAPGAQHRGLLPVRAGVDPDGVIHALERATQLMCEVGGGIVAAKRLDEYPAPIQHPRLNLRVSRTNQVLGTEFSPEQMLHLLRRLHLPALAVDEENLVLQVPPFRGDLEREVDLIEEIARLAGFDAIPVTLPRGVVATPRPGPEVRLLAAARQLLEGLGFFEVITYSFQPDRLGSLLTAAGAPAALRLANPLSEEQAMMRTSLLPGLLDTLRRNTLQQAQDVRLFEISKVFAPRAGEDLPQEEHWLTGLMYGAREEAAWNTTRDPVNFFDLKGMVETLLEGLRIPEVTFTPDGLPEYLRYGARVFSGSRELGVLGELRPDIGDQLDLEGDIFGFNLNFAALGQASIPPRFTPLPRYPAVYRDIAVMLPESVPAARVAEALYSYGRPWLVEAVLFDVYVGDPVPAGQAEPGLPPVLSRPGADPDG